MNVYVHVGVTHLLSISDLPHTVCSYKGIRWGLAYYDVATVEAVNNVELDLLTSVGFTAITSEEALRRAEAAGMQVKMVSPGRFSCLHKTP